MLIGHYTRGTEIVLATYEEAEAPTTSYLMPGIYLYIFFANSTGRGINSAICLYIQLLSTTFERVLEFEK